MENFENENNLQQKHTKIILSIAITIIITAITVGATVYYMQNNNFQKTQSKLQTKLSILEKELNSSEISNSELQIQISELTNSVRIDSNINNTGNIPNNAITTSDKPTVDTCSEEAVDKIFFSKKLYCAYKKSITEFNNGVETTIYTIDHKYEFGAITDLLSFSPNGSILFFNYHLGDNPKTNAINIKTKTLLYPESGKDGIHGRHIIWSPSKEYVLFAGGYFDGLQLKIASVNSIKSSVLVFETLDTSSEYSIYWKNDDVFVFNPIKDDCNNYAEDVYQKIGLSCETNEFKVKDYIK